jgi:hypothetical protein
MDHYIINNKEDLAEVVNAYEENTPLYYEEKAFLFCNGVSGKEIVRITKKTLMNLFNEGSIKQAREALVIDLPDNTSMAGTMDKLMDICENVLLRSSIEVPYDVKISLKHELYNSLKELGYIKYAVVFYEAQDKQ